MPILKNKIIALLLIFMGFLMYKIENDVTLFVFLTMFAIPIFLSKEDCFKFGDH